MNELNRKVRGFLFCLKEECTKECPHLPLAYSLFKFNKQKKMALNKSLAFKGADDKIQECANRKNGSNVTCTDNKCTDANKNYNSH